MATRTASAGRVCARPSGTVTFLFSDIEGSTERWERNREAMAVAVARHDALMRATLEACGGYIFKTMGDAFCAAFQTTSGAAAAALAAQRALLAEDFTAVDGLRVRIALHAGSADERDGDYFGPPINRVARLLAIGHGGQVLLSGSCADAVRGEIQPQIALRDLGAHRLKDLAQPEQVYQLIDPGLPQEFPPLRSLDHLSNNLPAQLTSFVGREEVVAEIKTLLDKHRLVTLVGTGGAGKTRCAVQAGAELLDRFNAGVWFAELAPIADPSLVASAIARILNVQESPTRPILETLLGYLKRTQLLLILDNCEHVIDEARRIAAAIVRGCPEVSILATSREGLNITGEEVYRMPSLTVPSKSESLSSEELSKYGAVQLFTDRALSANKSFIFDDESAVPIGEICRRLDGIPLAIELAAATVKVLSPKQLAQRLHERFRVLTGGDRSVLPRHQTMRALIDWSYDLLSDEERRFLRKLSIFAGGFTLETTAAVCSDGVVDEIASLGVLASLVDKSLVQADASASTARYRLLESTRQYAREKLFQSGEHDAVARAHAEAFLALAQQLHRSFDTAHDGPLFSQIESELENWRTALEWALVSRRDTLLGQRLAGALRYAWTNFSMGEGRRWVLMALEATDATTPPEVVATLHLVQAHLGAVLGQYKASYSAAEAALSLYRALGDMRGIADAQRLAGRALLVLGRVEEAERLLGEALTAARALGAHRLTGNALADLAGARYLSGDMGRARLQFEEALAICKMIGAQGLVAAVATNLAEAEFRAGDASTALRIAGEALATARSLNDARDVATLLRNMAAYLVALGRYSEAVTQAREGLAISRDLRIEVGIAYTLQHLAAVTALRSHSRSKSAHEDCARAARLLGYVDGCLTELDALREYTERQEYDKTLAALRDALGEQQLLTLMPEGRAWNEDQAVAEVMRL